MTSQRTNKMTQSGGPVARRVRVHSEVFQYTHSCSVLYILFGTPLEWGKYQMQFCYNSCLAPNDAYGMCCNENSNDEDYFFIRKAWTMEAWLWCIQCKYITNSNVGIRPKNPQ